MYSQHSFQSYVLLTTLSTRLVFTSEPGRWRWGFNFSINREYERAAYDVAPLGKAGNQAEVICL